MSELAELLARRDEVFAELQEIESLAAEGADRILEAVKAQRWYFFRNNKYILMDRDTGLLWANLDYFNYEEGKIGDFDSVSGLIGWEIPTYDEMIRMAKGTNFPFKEGSNDRIRGIDYWKTLTGSIDLDSCSRSSYVKALIPCYR